MSWLDSYLPASWRGVPFFVQEHDWDSGRRIASHEYALRDRPTTEDMGRKQRSYRVKAYVIANLTTQDYFDQRDALRQACEALGVGTLVHPYLGNLRVRLATVRMNESQDRGGMATFDLTFVESGNKPIASGLNSTAGTLLSGIQSAISQVLAAYAVASVIADRPTLLFGLASNALGTLAGGLLGLPPSVAGSLGQFAQQLSANLLAGPSPVTSAVNGVTGDPIAIAVTDAFTVAAQAVLTATAASTAAVDPVVGQVTTAILAPTDPTLGVAAFATWGGALPAPSGLQVQVQQQVQQQIIDLVNAAAVLAVAQIYAGTTWQTANAASAAKTQLLGFISAQLIASAASGNDALFQAWMSLSGMAITDLTQRAQNLPSLTSYATTARLPAPVLAQLLYQDGSQGTFLAALNGVIHPGFMPMRGVALSVLPGIGAN